MPDTAPMICEWIRVEDRLPEYGEVCAATNGRRRWLDVRIEGVGEELTFAGCRATHWHPLAPIPFTG